MPRVPTYDRFQARPNTLPQPRIAAPNMPDVAGKQAQQTGQAVTRAGQTANKIAVQQQREANQLRVDDALNAAKEEALRLTYDKEQGFTNLRGINALDRPDGKPLAEEYGETLQKRVDEIAGGLGNGAQRQAFQQNASDILTSFRGQAIRHESNEYRTYAESVSEGVQATAMRDIALNWNNPDAVQSGIDRIGAEVYRQANLFGKSAEWQEAQVREMTSTAHRQALTAALEQNDPMYAEAYLRRHSGEMNADDILAVRGHITKAVDAEVAVGAVQETMQRYSGRIAPSQTERAFNVAVGTESNGRQFDANGAPLESSAGAIGIAQVMPATAPEAAELAGLQWDEEKYRNDADYNRAIGLAYFQKQLQENDGHLAKAYAAYNAGPGRLQTAVANEENNREAGGTLNWLDFMPEETQAYVEKNMREYEQGKGKPRRPSLAEMERNLREDPRLARNPQRLKMAREELEYRFERQTEAIKQREDSLVADAMRGVQENGGRYSALPAGLRNELPPGRVGKVIDFAKKIAKGDDSTNLWLYNRLAADPKALAEMGGDEFYALRDGLSESDFKHFAKERAKAIESKQDGTDSPFSDAGTLTQQLSDATKRAGYDAETRAGFQYVARQEIQRVQREQDKELPFEERQKIIDRLLLEGEVIGGGFMHNPDKTYYEVVGTEDAEAFRPEVPDTERAAIEASLERNNMAVTDAAVVEVYKRKMGL
ncbi:transglycosylase SLT domain-containing protein [Guyparkeria halopsychrophila]|uniref:transglycosylase SLT domain-containing protein n=1 Tax=Guyparkeria halopsychrophila TaxID=3139421 RepID=UPI0037C888AC